MSCIWHRKKLNFLMNIHHPHHITNNHLYSQTNSIPITSICRERQLMWFGHVVRQGPHSPSYQALMLATDTSDIKKPRSRPPPPSMRWMNNVRKDLKSVELAISNAQSARPKLMTVNNGEKLSTDALAHALSDIRNCILLFFGRVCDRRMIVLYRDDGLAAVRSVSARDVDFLDITFQSPTGRFSAYRTTPPPPLSTCTDRHSNHPLSFSRVFQLGSIDVCRTYHVTRPHSQRRTALYNNALEVGGYAERVEYSERKRPAKIKKKRSRKSTCMIWFNPPLA